MVKVVPSASGFAVRDLRWALEALCGAERVREALDALPSEVREPFLAAPAEPWVPLRVTTAVVDEVAARVGENPEALVDRAIARATERSLGTVLRVLLRFTSNRALLERIPSIYRRTRNVGEVRILRIEEGSGEIEIVGWPDMPARHARLVAVNTETLLRCIGREDPRVHYKRTPDGARYQILWR